jgi:glycosyltransferase involved in cell wall biosynthesis
MALIFHYIPNAAKMINNVKVLFVGRLDSQKDPLTMLRAAKIVIQEESKTCFTLVGDGEMYKECEIFIRENRLESNVCLAGWQSDVASYYRTHHIFMASSLYEAFGLMFLEAGYYKLPVVATNVEGIPEVVEDKITGLLFPPKNHYLLAQNLLQLIRDEETRKDMGDLGYRRVIALFSSDRMVSQYKKIYERQTHLRSFR